MSPDKYEVVDVKPTNVASFGGRMDKAILKRLQALAKQHKVSDAAAMRRAIREWVEKHEKSS